MRTIKKYEEHLSNSTLFCFGAGMIISTFLMVLTILSRATAWEFFLAFGGIMYGYALSGLIYANDKEKRVKYVIK